MSRRNRVAPLPEPETSQSQGNSEVQSTGAVDPATDNRDTPAGVTGTVTDTATDLTQQQNPSPGSPLTSSNTNQPTGSTAKSDAPNIPKSSKDKSPFHFGLYEAVLTTSTSLPKKLHGSSAISKKETNVTPTKITQATPPPKVISKIRSTGVGSPHQTRSRQKTIPPIQKKTAVTTPRKPTKKRRKSKTLKPREYVDLARKEQEYEAAKDMAIFEAAKARAERRHSYGTHIHQKVLHLITEHNDNSHRESQGSSEAEELPATSAGAPHLRKHLSPTSAQRKRRSTKVKHVTSTPDENAQMYKEIDRRLGLKKKVSDSSLRKERVIMVDDVWVKNPDVDLPSASKPPHTVITITPSPRATASKHIAGKSGSGSLGIAEKKSRNQFTKTPASLETRTLKPGLKAPDIPLSELLKKSESKLASTSYGPMPESTYKLEAFQKAKELEASGALSKLNKGKSNKSLTKQNAKVAPIPNKPDKQADASVTTPEESRLTEASKTPSVSLEKKRKSPTRPVSPPPPRSGKSLWKKLSPERIRRELILSEGGGHLRTHFDARNKWKQAYTGVKEMMRLERLQRDRDYLEKESSSSSDHEPETNTATDAAAVNESQQLKKRGCMAKILNFFKESDDSDQKREDVLEQKRRHQKLENEEKVKLRKHKRKLRKKARENISKTIAKATLEVSVLTIVSKRLAERRTADNHQIGLVMAKEGGEAQGAPDPLALSNIKKVTSYREFSKTAHGALPSRKVDENPTANLFASLLPILKQKEGVTAKDAAEADAAIEKFRSTVRVHAHGTDDNASKQQEEKAEESLVNPNADIRAIPGNISQKRNVKHERDKAKRNEKVTDCCQNCCGNFGMRLRRIWREFLIMSEIWHSDILRIDGSFGVGCSTYFRWLRQVVLLNALYVLVSFSFLLFPELAMNPKTEMADNEAFQFQHIFIAEGVVGHSLMFYGAYQFNSDKKSYFRNTSFRFVFVVVIIFFLNSLYIGSRVREYYHHSIAKVTEREQKGELDLFGKVICSWDFNISNKDSAYAQHRSIARDFAEELDVNHDKPEAGNHKMMSGFKWMGKHGPFIMHQIINLVVLLFACGFGGLMYFFLSHGVSRSDKRDKSTACLQHFDSLLDVAPACCFSFMTAIFTPCCIWATNRESWNNNAQRTNYLIVRVGLIYIAMLSVFYIFWLDDDARINSGRGCCWENEFGKELYRIVICEGISNIIVSALVYKGYPFFQRKCLKREFTIEFEVENNQINLIFLHTLSGLGIFYSPVLPAIILIRLLVTFYWKKYLLFSSCCFPQHQLHQKDIYSPYLAAFFLSYLMVTVMSTWIIAEVHPSQNCGPFRNYDMFINVFHTTEGTSFIGGIVAFAVQAQFVYFCLFLLVGVIVTFRAWGIGYFETMKNLHELLQLERLDREFLLKAMYNIAKTNEAKLEGGADDIDDPTMDEKIENAAKPALVRRRDALPEPALRRGIMDFMEQQRRLDELFPDEPSEPGEDVGGPSSRVERRPTGYPLEMTLSPKAIKRLRNKRLSIPAVLFLDTTDTNKLRNHKAHGSK